MAQCIPNTRHPISAPVQEIAQHYLAALRHGGTNLLTEARILYEARTTVPHGEWLPFLHAIDRTPDTAERLLHIHRLATTNPAFAEAVRTNWLSPSTAALLARPSTPPAVIHDVLAADTPPTRTEAEHQIHAAKTAESTEQKATADTPACDPPTSHESSITNQAPHLTSLVDYLLGELAATTATVSIDPAVSDTPLPAANVAVPDVPSPAAQPHITQAAQQEQQQRAFIARMFREYGTNKQLARLILGTLLRTTTERLCAMTRYTFCIPCTRTTLHLLRHIERALDRLDDIVWPQRRKHPPTAPAGTGLARGRV